MTSPVAVPREARSVRQEWLRLATATASPPAFDLAMTAGLPQPARRWLAHAISTGTPLWRTVELSMRGQIRLGQWRPFTAKEILAPSGGYIWAATARVAGLPVTGFDRLSSGTGQMSWRLLRLIPVMTAAGPDTTRSAAGRLAGEIALLPTAFLTAKWEQGERADTIRASWQFGDDTETAELRVADDGRLLEVEISRWGNPDGGSFSRYPFGFSVEAESEFDGVTIPSQFRAGWWWRTDRQDAGEFFKVQITQAIFR
ncbi:MAG: DUF6544 family protein [Micromonosporaceae bacterium]